MMFGMKNSKVKYVLIVKDNFSGDRHSVMCDTSEQLINACRVAEKSNLYECVDNYQTLLYDNFNEFVAALTVDERI